VLACAGKCALSRHPVALLLEEDKPMAETVANYIGGAWEPASTARTLDVRNPATGERLAALPLSGKDETNRAVSVAREAFNAWRHVPAGQRVNYLFRYKELLERSAEELARIITREHGKTLDEARGSVRRGIQNVEFACGMPALLMGESLEDVTAGIDCRTYRQPLGVFAATTPSSYPAMVPLWFWPYAVAAGNTFVVKPSEEVPLSQQFMFQLAEEARFPAGVLNLLFGDKDTSEALLDHPDVAGFSFVGSTPVARDVYRRAAQNGKRVQALGGGKNHLVVMPDAKLDKTVATAIDACFSCTGQRGLAGSVIIAVNDAYKKLRPRLVEAAKQVVVGNGMDFGVSMGPMVSAGRKDRVLSAIAKGVEGGAKLLLDGRDLIVKAYPDGNWLGPTIFDEVTGDMEIAREEIAGPVMMIRKAATLGEAIEMIRSSQYANAASIFTTSGKSAREFRYSVGTSMIGINIGVPTPVAYFPYGGIKDSFFGDTKAHGKDAVRFFTDVKVTVSRWF